MRTWPLRDFADGPHRRVDDRPYGGGPGMVMLFEPLERALTAIRTERAEAHPVPLVHFTPTGERIDQRIVDDFAAGPGAVLLCGRYEGIDQRFIDRYVDRELSLGDFVLSGGELPALALLDAVARLQEGVLGDPESHRQDSFSDGLLEGPHFSRPERCPDDAGCGARRSAVGAPRSDRALAPRACSRAHGAAPPRPDRCRPGGWPARRRRTSGFSRPGCYNRRLFDPLHARNLTVPPTHTSKRVARSQE